MGNLKIRCSALGMLMTNPRKKTEVLSETAKSYIKNVAYSDFFGIKKEISTKEMTKGIECEQDTIDLLNLVEFENYTKSDASGDNGWLTGHPDILTDTGVIDVKTSWSFETFPILQEDVEKMIVASKYEWQVRGYMMLFEKEWAKVVWGLVDTPDELLTEWDNEALHKVSHIEPNKRISCSKSFERCLDIESEIKERYDAGNEFYKQIIEELKNK